MGLGPKGPIGIDTFQQMRWMRRRGDRVTITTGKYADHRGAVASNVYQKTVDYPDQ